VALAVGLPQRGGVLDDLVKLSSSQELDAVDPKPQSQLIRITTPARERYVAL